MKTLLSRGIAVLTEKPLAHKVDDAETLTAFAAKQGALVTAVGYCHRFAPAVIEMRKQIADGALGTILRFENTFAFNGPAMETKWMSDPAIAGGGSFIDTGCHSLDLYRFLLGDATVIGATYYHPWPGRGESTATVLLRGSGDHAAATAVIQSGWLEPARFIVAVIGTKGMLSYDYGTPADLIFRPSEGAAKVITVESHEVRFTNQLLAFADAVQGGDRKNLATFEDGLRVAKLVASASSASQPRA